MPFLSKQLIAQTFVALILVPVAIDAQAVPPANANQEGTNATTPADGAVQFTGKERLGEKWEDEQRINNCKVPFGKRGTKPRPDSCAHRRGDARE